MLQHFEGLAIGDLRDAIGNGCHAVVQVHLARHDVNSLVLFRANAAAAGKKDAMRQAQAPEIKKDEPTERS